MRISDWSSDVCSSDLLPGSSIAWVHREAEADHKRLAAELERIVQGAIRALTGVGDRRFQANSAPVTLDATVAGAIAAVPAAPPAPATIRAAVLVDGRQGGARDHRRLVGGGDAAGRLQPERGGVGSGV